MFNNNIDVTEWLTLANDREEIFMNANVLLFALSVTVMGPWVKDK